MSDFFRVIRGIELDETIRYMQGANAPGHSADTDSANIGSVYTDNVTGTLYTKRSAGPGPSTWQSVSVGGGSNLQLYSEFASSPTPPAALGTNSIALGVGATTDIDAANSFAFGEQAYARYYGAKVEANGRFQTTGDAQVGRYILRTHTVNSTATEAFLDGTNGSARLILPDNSTWAYTITVTAHRTDLPGGHAGYKAEGVIYRDSGAATVSMQGRLIKSVLAESNPSWDINIVADSSHGSLSIMVTGQTGKTIRWLALVETVEITN